MAPYNPLAVQRLETREAELQARVDAGNLSPEQARSQFEAFALMMFERHGDPKVVPRQSAEGEPPTT